MRVPLSWLREYVDVELTPDELATRLTLLGMEVRSIERWGEDWQKVVVGELLEVEPHPRADRLSLTRVTVGDGEPLEIVCGATNIAPGQHVPVALPGAVLPGNRRIDRTEKMGVISNGMLCSGEELHLTGDADGILILPEDAPIGRPLIELYGDVVLDVDVKPNRGDALSLIGLAREVAAATGAPVRWPDTEPSETGDPIDRYLIVQVEDPDLCSRFVARWVAGVDIRPSPDRVQMRLLAAGMRPVSNVVDVSNYVMLELGKPIHTFDAATVGQGENGRAHLIVRRAHDGERLETLDHVQRTLDSGTLLIADPRGPLGIAGVMGGAGSEIGPSTTDVLVESAVFDPVSIRRTGQRYALRSEASLRFEKGQEFRLARIGADRTARLITEWAGGSVARGRVDTAPDEPDRTRVIFRPARVNRLLGTDISTDEQRTLLDRVGVETEETHPAEVVTVALKPDLIAVEPVPGEALAAIVPTWRRDIVLEADVVEEIARVRGYENVPSITPHTPMPDFRRSPLEIRQLVRETLVGAGLTEATTFALVSPGHLEELRLSQPVPSIGGETQPVPAAVHVTNPLSRDHSVLRQGLIGSLLDVVSTNHRHGRTDVAIFEVGKGYGRDGDRPVEWWRLGLALTGDADPASWNQRGRPYDLDDAKGLIALLCGELDFDPPAFTPDGGERILHPGRTARVEARRGGDVVVQGVVGDVHPGIVERLELRTDRAVVAELAIEGLSAGHRMAVRSTPPSRHPVVERDLAVIVDEARPAADIERVIRVHGGPLLRSVALFDIYRGAPLETGAKSLAERLTFSDPDRTLTEPEVDAAIEAITTGLRHELGARFRT